MPVSAPTTSSISARLNLLLTELTAFEEASDKESAMLNAALDLHNALTDWATNTEHEKAAHEIMAILDQHVLSLKQDAQNRLSVPSPAPSKL